MVVVAHVHAGFVIIVIMAYRVYFKDGGLDPSFPPPQPPKEIVVPAEKPRSGAKPYYIAMNSTGIDGETGDACAKIDDADVDVAGIIDSDGSVDRRSVLKEVREVSWRIAVDLLL